jgi:hypothetical protein
MSKPDIAERLRGLSARDKAPLVIAEARHFSGQQS